MNLYCDYNPRGHGTRSQAYRMKQELKRGNKRGFNFWSSLPAVRTAPGVPSPPAAVLYVPPTQVSNTLIGPQIPQILWGVTPRVLAQNFPCACLYVVPFRRLSSRNAAWPLGAGNGGIGSSVRLILCLMYDDVEPDPSAEMSCAVRRYSAGVMPFPKRWVTWLAQRRPTKMFTR